MNSLKTYLTEAYAIDNKSILRILTQNKQINKSDPDYTYYEKLANWANSSGKQQKLKNIDLNTIKLTDRSLLEKRKLTTRYTTLGHLLLALKNLMDQEGKYTKSSEISRLVQQTTLDVLVSLSGIDKKPAEKPDDIEEEPVDDNPTDESELYAGMDWTAEKARRLAEASTEKPASVILDKFYNDYYSIEYAGVASPEKDTKGIVAKLKSLDKILIPEFNALGYNPDVNPFAQFLKILIEKKRDIFDKLNTNTYGAVHNAFIAKHVTGNMLGNYSKENILFCNDLYNYKGLDIVNYLSLQKQALTKAENSSKYSDDKKLIAKMFIQQQVLDKNYAENVRKLFDEPVSIEITAPDNTSAKLKSELEVQELYRHLFKSIPKKAVNSKTAEEILERAKKADVVLSMIRYILDKDEFANSRKYAEFVQDTEEWLEKTCKYNKNEANIAKSEKILADYILDVSAENLIVRNLREYAEKVKAATEREEADK
jgi:hypothetical protein